MSITTKEKEKIFEKFGSGAKDSGSVYSQVALFTSKIKLLTDHENLIEKILIHRDHYK